MGIAPHAEFDGLRDLQKYAPMVHGVLLNIFHTPPLTPLGISSEQEHIMLFFWSLPLGRRSLSSTLHACPAVYRRPVGGRRSADGPDGPRWATPHGAAGPEPAGHEWAPDLLHPVLHP